MRRKVVEVVGVEVAVEREGDLHVAVVEVEVVGAGEDHLEGSEVEVVAVGDLVVHFVAGEAVVGEEGPSFLMYIILCHSGKLANYIILVTYLKYHWSLTPLLCST